MTKEQQESETDKKTLASRIESVLFLHGEPMKKKKLAERVGGRMDALDAALSALRARYEDADAGLSLVEHDGAVELATSPENADVTEAFVAAEREESLGKATLETLSIIAYRGPVTRNEIDAIRGVNSSFALRNLLLRGLVDREPNPLDAREYRYTTSFRLLELLGISSLSELPEYESLSADARLSAVAGEEESGEDTKTEAS